MLLFEIMAEKKGNWTIRGIENTDFECVSRISYRSFYNREFNNRRLEKLWQVLREFSNGTLTHQFSDLYAYGSAFFPAYQVEGEMSQRPPSAVVRYAETDIDLLFAAYHSFPHLWGGGNNPAVLSIWAHRGQKPVAKQFVRELRQRQSQVGSTNPRG